MVKLAFLFLLFYFKTNYAFAYVGLGAFAPFLWQIILVIIVFIIGVFSIFYNFFIQIKKKINKNKKKNN
jgi:uncharacterized membrane protein